MAKIVAAGLVPLVLAGGIFYFQSRRNVAEQDRRSAQGKAETAAAALDQLFREWRSELLIASRNDVLRQWYADPDNQESLRPSVEAALVQFNTLYPDLIDEACLIDAGGRESAREVHGETAPLDDLSPDESEAPFFAPTFELAEGEVHQHQPYVSADSGRWVVSNTTPLLLDGEVVGLLHFEAGIEGVRQRLAEIVGEDAQVRVVDSESGDLILDTASQEPVGDADFVAASKVGVEGDRAQAHALAGGDSGNANRWRVEVSIPATSPLRGRDVLPLLAVVLASVAVLGFLARRLGRTLVNPITRMTEIAERLADGDLTQRVDHARDDEVGAMAAAMNRATSRLDEVFTDIAGQSETLDGFAQDLTAASEQIAATAESSHASAERLARAVSGVSDGMESLTAGAEHVDATTREIAARSEEATKVTNEAAQLMARVSDAVVQLRARSEEIQDVVHVIDTIAAQTNLLALNATIEAARAGDSGKGFAVVAGEVKDLASETSQATAVIAQRIEAVRTDAATVIETIEQIAAVVEQVDAAQEAIGTAVGEQSETTGAMRRDAAGAAAVTGDLRACLDAVAEATSAAASGAQRNREAAADLATMANGLASLTGSFQYGSGGG